MPRPIRPWLRIYVEMCRDRKIRRLTPAQRWLWVAVLCAARESPEPGALYVARGVPMSTEELADYAGVSPRDARAGIAVMVGLHMVTIENEVVHVTNWESRQFESDDVTRRTRTSRERSGERRRNVPGNAPDTETETDTSGGDGMPSPETAQTLLAEWLDRNSDRPPSRLIGHVSRELKAMLDEGIPYDVVRAGLAQWHRKSLHPSALASVVHETRRAAATRPSEPGWHGRASLPTPPPEIADDPAAYAKWIQQQRPAG